MPGLLTSSCNVRTLLGLEHMSAIGVDLVCGAKTLGLIKEFGLPGKILFAGAVDGHNIWANDLAASVTVIEEMQHALGKGKFLMYPFL